MPLIEAVTIELGAAIAQSIVKLWIKDSTLGDTLTSGLLDLFKAKTEDILAQRRGARQFAAIGEKIGESLLPLFLTEGARLDEGSCITVAYAVAETFNTAKLSSELLVKHNLEPVELEHDIRTTHPDATQHFSSDETEFYKRIIKESCVYVVDIASQLPAFTERTFAEVLKREEQISNRVDVVLHELSQIRKQLDPMQEAERFEIDYRQAIVRNLDFLQLFGADVSRSNRHHRLSVAYIMLSVEQSLLAEYSEHTFTKITSEYITIPEIIKEQEKPINDTSFIENTIVPVDKALATSSRMLIRGLAGSGKTTLLQWIAVRAATKSFEDQLVSWNNKLPFYIRLRQFSQGNLPGPEMFPGLVAPIIADTMPKGWVHHALREGRALVLVDGVDEIASARREEIHTWLKDLVATYPQVGFVVTSRPHAIEEGWLDYEAFSNAELQAMKPADIASFIDHWHQAVYAELQTEEEKTELAPLAAHLKEQIRRNRPIRNLATSPLLCSMLCALNRERRRQLPGNRIELYEACCTLLLGRRDKERRVDLADYPTFSYKQKVRLLGELAYWMIKENLSEADVKVVDDSFTSRLTNMPTIAADISGTDVRRLFVRAFWHHTRTGRAQN